MVAPAPATKLGQAKKGAEAAPGKFAQAIAGARVRHPFVIPRLEVPAVMTLVAANRVNEIEGAVWERMRALKLELNITTEANFELDRACRILAEAVIDPDEAARGNFIAFGTVAEWASLEPGIVAECWRIYGDVRELHDPVGVALSREDFEAITEAVKKKQDRLLRYYGARRLALWLTTTDGQPWSSPLPMSGPSESSEGTSPPAG